MHGRGKGEGKKSWSSLSLETDRGSCTNAVAMGKPTHIVRTPPAHQAKVFHQVNPSEIFSDLEEIGHGSFGSVYKVCTYEHEVACRSISCKSPSSDLSNKCTSLI